MKKFLSFIFLFTVSSVLVGHAEDLQKNKNEKKIRWVLAHEPVGLFKEAADYFSREMKKKTDGQVIVEVLTVPEFEKIYNNGKKIQNKDVVKLIQSGKIEMSQTYTTDLGMIYPDMFVLDLPFLFRNHAHAKKALEGPVGERLLAGLSQANVRGLAFTYSGGYRIIPSKKPISKLEDFQGLKVRTSNSPVAQDTFKALGANPVPMGLDDVTAAVQANVIEAAESTYPRFYAMKQNEFSQVLNDTQHSLFLTSIILNDKMWNSLSAKEQSLFKEVALAAARIERDHAVQDAEVTKKKCEKEGIKVYELAKSEQEKFKTLMKPLYEKYSNVFSKELIAQIQD